VIGIFDSGVGGLTALAELRKLLPDTDMIYLADRDNAPYGTKSDGQILAAAESCIKRLSSAGAYRILIACCTASTLHSRLCDASRAVTTPIILPAADAAIRVSHGHIAVIATDATVRSRAFSQAILSRSDCEVSEHPAQKLVTMVESGASDKAQLNDEQKSILSLILSPVKESRADTLILGCTHFAHLTGHIAAMLPGINLISPSREGALELAKSTVDRGRGRTVFL
jgi:glutamate racemase